MDDFSWKRDFKKIQWKDTLVLLLVRAFFASVIWTLIMGISQSIPAAEFFELFLGLLILAVLGPFVAMVVSALAETIPYIGLINLPIIILLIVADPLLFIINKLYPPLVPVESYGFISFRAITFVLEQDMSKLPKEELTAQLLEMAKCASVLNKKEMEYVKQLLRNGADPNARDDSHSPPIIHAASDNTELLQLLIEYGADVNTDDEYSGRPLYIAAIEDSPLESLEVLVRHGANINEGRSEDKRTPLMGAVYSGYIDKVRFLVEQGAGINLQRSDGETALDEAYGSIELHSHGEPGERFEREIQEVIEYLKANGGLTAEEMAQTT